MACSVVSRCTRRTTGVQQIGARLCGTAYSSAQNPAWNRTLLSRHPLPINERSLKTHAATYMLVGGWRSVLSTLCSVNAEWLLKRYVSDVCKLQGTHHLLQPLTYRYHPDELTKASCLRFHASYRNEVKTLHLAHTYPKGIRHEGWNQPQRDMISYKTEMHSCGAPTSAWRSWL